MVLGIVEKGSKQDTSQAFSRTTSFPSTEGHPGTYSPHFGGPHAAQQSPGRTAEVSCNL